MKIVLDAQFIVIYYAANTGKEVIQNL